MGFWIPNVDAVELGGTRKMHLEMSNQETATVELRIPENQLGAARFWGLRNGGAVHPQHSLLHIASIDVDYSIPKEFEGNTKEYYQDDLVTIILNYRQWQMPNQGYESVIENIGQVVTVPLRGLYWQQPGFNNIPNFHDPVWGNVPAYIRRGNMRIVRTYTGRIVSPTYIWSYHNTVNSKPGTILEWGITIPPGGGMFTCGNFRRQRTRDYSSNNPLAEIDIWSFSYAIEIMEGTWNALHHPSGNLARVFDRFGNRVSFYPEAAWELSRLLE